MATPSPTTFKVSDVKPEHFSSRNKTATNSSICSQLKSYNKNHCTEVLMETQFSSNVRASVNNGFVNTAIDCYNSHHNLVIRPDDIWTAIMTQFSFYVNANAEEFRGQFVNFEGKKELIVTMGGSLRSAPYDVFVTLMTEKINENLLDNTVKDWVLPNFTTTTPNDIISCGIVLMATMKKYFDYGCCLMCGIPNFTLEGTVNDWENILNRLEKLKTYKLDKWYDMLQPILKEFVAAKKNAPNRDFWNRICHYSGGGSGPTFISGWLTAFSVFDVEGNWTDCCNEAFVVFNIESETMTNDGNDGNDGNDKTWPKIDIDKIPSGVVTADVKIKDMNAEYDSLMFAGHVAYEVLDDDFTLKPRIGWGIALKLADKDVDIVHEAARGEGEYFCNSCNVELME